MAIPLQSLSGTEVLRRGCVNNQQTSGTHLKFDGTAPTTTGQSGNTVPANHIITILNIYFVEQANIANQQLHMWVTGPHSSSIYLLNSFPIAAYQTFVWRTKFSLIGGDTLIIQTNVTNSVDIWYNYIDQSWV